MNKSFAVIGANFGDEGKGLMTDYLCSIHEPDAVVRFNGGAQAGHTVVSRLKGRHVFHHFGSGTMLKVPTFLSIFFVVNPVLFLKEYRELINKGIDPGKVVADPDCFVTCPFDMIMNQAAERSRGLGRHGSCGVGVHETLVRSDVVDYRLKMKDLYDPGNIEDKLLRIRKKWIPERLKALGIDSSYSGMFDDDAYIEQFVDDCKMMSRLVDLGTHHRYKGKSVVFEGAQGLILDRDNMAMFPYLTPSNTGMKNVVFLASQMGVENLEAVYVTRTYLTRHGAGPFFEECPPFEDDTNVEHEFQGKLRFAYFNTIDFRGLYSRIINDITKHIGALESTKFDFSIAATHADQHLYTAMLNHPDCAYVSFGPTRADVRYVRGEFFRRKNLG